MEIDAAIEEYKKNFQVPVTDVLKPGCAKPVNKIDHLFPDLEHLRNPMI